MSGIAGGSEQFSAGESGLVKQPLDCAVRAFIITYIVYCRHHGLGHLLNLRCCKPTYDSIQTPTILSISFDPAGYLKCIGSLQTHIYKPDVHVRRHYRQVLQLNQRKRKNDHVCMARLRNSVPNN